MSLRENSLRRTLGRLLRFAGKAMLRSVRSRCDRSARSSAASHARSEGLTAGSAACEAPSTLTGSERLAEGGVWARNGGGDGTVLTLGVTRGVCCDGTTTVGHVQRWQGEC